MTERVLILDFGSQYTQLIGGKTTACLRWQGWIFLFYSADWREPPHVHARKGRKEAKFWLSDCSVAAARRVPQHELSASQRKVRQHRDEFMEKWHGPFGGGA